MRKKHYFQEETDEGLHLANVLLRVKNQPQAVRRTDWLYLNTIRIATIELEASITHREAIHVANEIDHIEADVSKMGMVTHLTDALMMWIVAAGFLGSAILLGVLGKENGVGENIAIPLSLGAGLFFFCAPFLARHRALKRAGRVFGQTITNILGTGLMKRSVLVSESLIRDLGQANYKEVLFEVVRKFVSTRHESKPDRDEMVRIEMLLSRFGLTPKDLNFVIEIQEDAQEEKNE